MSRAARSGRWLFLLLALLCVAPRAARLALPETSVAGSSSGQAALLLARGYEPYRHVALPGLPVGEQALALAVRAFGPGLVVAELVNDAVILLVAAALYVAGRRLAGPLAGGAAAVLWSWSAWVTHVNLLARGDWAALGAALALAVYFAPRPLTGRRAALLALPLLLALGVQLAAATTALALLAHLLATGRARSALRLLVALSCGAALIVLLGRAAWGEPFLEQVLALPFGPPLGPTLGSSAADPAAGGALERLLALTDPVIAAGLVGLFVVGLPRLARPEGAVALVLVAELAVALVRGAALRVEDAISLVPACALLAGALLAELCARREQLPLAALASVFVVVAVTTVPETWLPAEPGEGVRGAWFGGRSREVIERQARLLDRFSRPQDLVATTEPWSAFVADRIEFARAPPGRLVSRGAFVQALSLREIALVTEPLGRAGTVFDWDLREAGYRRFTDDATGLVGWRPAHGWPHPQVRPLERLQGRP